MPKLKRKLLMMFSTLHGQISQTPENKGSLLPQKS
jgi:hypothetical protein